MSVEVEYMKDHNGKEEKITIHQENEDDLDAQGFKRNLIRTIVFYLACLLSGGILRLLSYWYPWRRVKLTHNKCGLEQAEVIIVSAHDDTQEIPCNVKEEEIEYDASEYELDDLIEFEREILRQRKIRFFHYMFLKYFIFDGKIIELSGLDKLLTRLMIQKYSQNGISVTVRNIRQKIFGENHINVPVPSFIVYVLKEAANPFYLFQVFSFTIWILENYIYYPIIIFCITIISIIVTAYQTQKQMKDLQGMVGQPYKVNCHENQQTVEKSSTDLIPGDILLIPEKGMDIPCDVILLEGSCVVNESSLTGESFPISKEAYEEQINNNSCYVIDHEKLHTIQYGTEVIQAGSYDNDEKYVRALVIRTGFSTMKGRLIREIAFPKPIFFIFNKEATKFLLFLGLLGLIGLIYTAILMSINEGASVSDIILRSLDIITIIVPPALPACLSIGAVFALKNLREKKIFCVDSQRINMCGVIDLFVFDKTGTLTEDHLNIKCTWTCNHEGQFVRIKKEDVVENESENALIKALASCHSLHFIDGNISGSPEDTEMFKFSGWIQKNTESGKIVDFESPCLNGNSISIIREFQFESALQRMSVVTKESESNYVNVYMKGSPEMVRSFCAIESLPENFEGLLKEETIMGHRVLAIASKNMKTDEEVKELPRSTIESNLNFIGFVIFENSIKECSKGAISTLHKGGIRSIIATGDNLNTAVSVAKEVDIIQKDQKTCELFITNKIVYCKPNENTAYHDNSDSTIESPTTETSSLLKDDTQYGTSQPNYSIVLTGKVFEKIRTNHPEILPKVLLSASVYSRMSPVHKTSLIEELKKSGYYVGMCGDGANDCGALKAANAGIALSRMEASVAAPFTSKEIFDISCVPDLICEGRAALVTSFSVFKYMAMYSFVQFFGVLIMTYSHATYGDWQFFYADIIVFLLAMAITKNPTSTKLSKRKPPARLGDPSTIIFVFLQLCVVLAFQVVPFVVMKDMSWYKSPKELKEHELFNLPSYENYSVVCVSFFQYIWVAIICSTNEPYRKPLTRNPWFIGSFVLTFATSTLVTFAPIKFIETVFEFPSYLPTKLCVGLLIYSTINLVAFLIVDRLLNRFSAADKDDTSKDIEIKEVFGENWPPFKNVLSE